METVPYTAGVARRTRTWLSTKVSSLESSWRPINDEADLTAASSRVDIFADCFPSSSSALLGVVGEVDISGDVEDVEEEV